MTVALSLAFRHEEGGSRKQAVTRDRPRPAPAEDHEPQGQRAEFRPLRRGGRGQGGAPVKSLGGWDFNYSQDATAQSFYGEDALTRAEPLRPRRRSG
jgi:hypothetical protein